MIVFARELLLAAILVSLSGTTAMAADGSVVRGRWSAIGSDGHGDGALRNGAVEAIAVAGGNLYVGGCFENVFGIPEADFLAKWDGSQWSALGSDGHGDGALNSCVRALAVSGTDLDVGGDFTGAGGDTSADFIARWDGASWSALGSNGSGGGALSDYVFALAVSGPDLYVGGQFLNAAGIPTADLLAMWDGDTWSALSDNGHGNGALGDPARYDQVSSLAMAGPDLYVGGSFLNAAGNARADKVAKWDGIHWSALGSNGHGNGALNNNVHALLALGSDLFVGGEFLNAGGRPKADGIARWDGLRWSNVGSDGHGHGALDGSVNALARSGAKLYVGGEFQNAAGIAKADMVARWRAGHWFALGSNGQGDGALTGAVDSLTVDGATLYVGGAFLNAAGKAKADWLAAFTPQP